MPKKKDVSFIAMKKVTKPVRVSFKTSEGKRISFTARRTVTKPVRVKFKAKK